MQQGPFKDTFVDSWSLLFALAKILNSTREQRLNAGIDGNSADVLDEAALES